MSVKRLLSDDEIDEEDDNKVWLGNDFVMKELCRFRVSDNAFDRFLFFCDLGWSFLLQLEANTFLVLDSDLKEVRRGVLPFSASRYEQGAFSVRNSLVALNTDRAFWVLDLKTGNVVFNEEHVPLKGWQGNACCFLSEKYLLHTRTNALGAELVCRSTSDVSVQVCSIQLETKMDGRWFLRAFADEVRVLCAAGQDGSISFFVEFDEEEVRFVDVVADEFAYDAVDIICSADGEFEFKDRSRGFLEIDADDDEVAFSFVATPTSLSEDSAIVLTCACRFFLVNLSDPLVLCDHVVFPGLTSENSGIRMERGLGTRLLTFSDNDVKVWEGGEMLQYYVWLDWTPKTHRIFPLAFHNSVKALLMSVNRVHRIPKDMRNELAKYVARAWQHGWRRSIKSFF